MHHFGSTIFVSAILALTAASPAPLPSYGTAAPDVVPDWNFTAYSDSGCNSLLGSITGNSPSGCQPLDSQANSYRFTSIPDPKIGVTFGLHLFASPDCNDFLLIDSGASDDCHTMTFESWEAWG